LKQTKTKQNESANDPTRTLLFGRTGAEGKREVDGRAARTIYRAQNLEDANHLIFLEGKVFLVVDLGFFAFENGSKGE
jgi:hypothetical protein